jgi:hypothetical protein
MVVSWAIAAEGRPIVRKPADTSAEPDRRKALVM